MKIKLLLTLLFTILLLPLYLGFGPVFTMFNGWQDFSPRATTTAALEHTEWQKPIQQSRAIVEQQFSALGTPSLSVAVGKNGQLIWAQAWGYADLTTAQLADTATRYRLGSTSKFVTAMLLGKMLAQNQLTLDAPIRQYFPQHQFANNTMTLRQVMSHSAGIRDYGWCFCAPVWETLNRRHFATVTASLSTIESDALRFEPGSDFLYSSLGFNIGGAVIERVSGQHFLTTLQQQLTLPLKLDSLSGEHDRRHDAVFYETRDDIIRPSTDVDLSIKWPSGGLLAKPSDLVKLGNAFLSDGIFPATIRQQLSQAQRLNDGRVNPQNYAIGMRHDPDWPLHKKTMHVAAIHHGGVAQGSTSWLIVFPQQQLVIALAINRQNRQFNELTRLGDAIAEQFIALNAP